MIFKLSHFLETQCACHAIILFFLSYNILLSSPFWPSLIARDKYPLGQQSIGYPHKRWNDNSKTENAEPKNEQAD
jgi:hypothetical protein